jgi:hypothetical protein
MDLSEHFKCFSFLSFVKDQPESHQFKLAPSQQPVLVIKQFIVAGPMPSFQNLADPQLPQLHQYP